MNHTLFEITHRWNKDDRCFIVKACFDGEVYCTTCGKMRDTDYKKDEEYTIWIGREHQPVFYGIEHGEYIYPVCSLECYDVFETTPPIL